MYSGTVVRQSFTIPAEKVEAAYVALMKWAEGHRTDSYEPISTNIMKTAKDLHQAMQALGWDTVTKDGAVVGLQQRRHDCCGVDHVDAMNELAPYVTAHSSLIFFGENEEIFRWFYDGEHMHEEMGGAITFGETTFQRMQPVKPGKLMLLIHDLITVQREVELPEKCPNCDHMFVVGDDLRVWEYQDQGRRATIISSPEAVFVEEDDFDWQGLPQGGESWLYISWQCCECNYVLAESTTKQFVLDSKNTTSQPPPGVKDLLNITE